jgi:hypothetical protein
MRAWHRPTVLGRRSGVPARQRRGQTGRASRQYLPGDPALTRSGLGRIRWQPGQDETAMATRAAVPPAELAIGCRRNIGQSDQAALRRTASLFRCLCSPGTRLDAGIWPILETSRGETASLCSGPSHAHLAALDRGCQVWSEPRASEAAQVGPPSDMCSKHEPSVEEPSRVVIGEQNLAGALMACPMPPSRRPLSPCTCVPNQDSLWRRQSCSPPTGKRLWQAMNVAGAVQP